MKRSEMLEEISKYLKEYARGTYSELEMANLILEMQEEKGMSPPLYTDYKLGDVMDFYQVPFWKEEKIDYLEDKEWRNKYGKED